MSEPPVPLLQACLNGARRPGEHSRLPVSPSALAHDAAAARAAGAGSLHLHVKDPDGADTLAAAPLADVLGAVRAAVPGLPVGVTTGAWALPDPAERVRAVRAWTALPDEASVNWHEPGADAVAQALLERGVGVEAGLWHADAVRTWLASPVRERFRRVLVELPDDLDAAQSVAEAGRLLEMLANSPVPVLLHGEGESCWPTLRHAGELGLATRIGLEDTLTLPDGRPAPDNETLVRSAAGVLAGAAG